MRKNLGRKVDRDEETRRVPVPFPEVIKSMPQPPVDTPEALQGGIKGSRDLSGIW